MWAKGRYRVPVYGRHFTTALDLIARPEVGLIESVERGYKFTGGNKRLSTIKPTAAFVARVRPALTGWESFARAEVPEVLIMKSPKDRKTGRAEPIEYPETASTRGKRKEVQRIKEVLRNAPLKLATGDDGYATCFMDDGQPIDPTRRAVRIPPATTA
jgi:hypothetical protein